jgi:hypothetical protein
MHGRPIRRLRKRNKGRPQQHAPQAIPGDQQVGGKECKRTCVCSESAESNTTCVQLGVVTLDQSHGTLESLQVCLVWMACRCVWAEAASIPKCANNAAPISGGQLAGPSPVRSCRNSDQSLHHSNGEWADGLTTCLSRPSHLLSNGLPCPLLWACHGL